MHKNNFNYIKKYCMSKSMIRLATQYKFSIRKKINFKVLKYKAIVLRWRPRTRERVKKCVDKRYQINKYSDS